VKEESVSELGAVNGKAAGRRLACSHRDLEVYRRAVDVAMSVFAKSRGFPREETCSLTSQILRSSRSVAANLTEASRKRRYEAAFISKLSDAESEAAETQTHIEFAVKCGYLSRQEGAALYRDYERLIRTIVGMIHHSDRWVLHTK
jgi:four helix bundle protein